jgi:hypothetical protein
MTQPKKTTLQQHVAHELQLFEHENDAYRDNEKLSEPTVCPNCTAVYHQGRWQWIEATTNAKQKICPACQRIQDKIPAGFITFEGDFFNKHSEEIRRMIQHHADHERIEHPLKRIIAIDNQGDTMLVTTTDTHLARGIGEAVRHAYQGVLKIDHVPGENLVRVHWVR